MCGKSLLIFKNSAHMSALVSGYVIAEDGLGKAITTAS